MKSFIHINARTVEEACRLLRQFDGKAVLQAGGTDLLSTLKGEGLSDYPEALINIKTISGFESIEADDQGLKIGAGIKLSRMVESSVLQERYKVLAEAAHTVASPQIRNMATLGGNLCQDVRCWYYRYPRHIGGPVQCARKGRGPCLAVKGDNRYHAILGGKKCFAVGPSDTAVALAALDGCLDVVGPDGERKVAITDFFSPLAKTLKKDEMIRSIEVPPPPAGARQSFLKFTLRKPIDFAIVSVAAVIDSKAGRCQEARIALGALAPGPVRAYKAEAYLKGRPLNRETAGEAAEQALMDARPLSMNAYKIEIAKTLVKRSILGTLGAE